jgi:Domain of unknown function (DUF397)
VSEGKDRELIDLSRAVWRKSTYSANGTCVEVAFVDDFVAIRDSKDQLGPALLFTLSEWTAFTKGISEGQFSRPN